MAIITLFSAIDGVDPQRDVAIIVIFSITDCYNIPQNNPEVSLLIIILSTKGILPMYMLAFS